jgi:hypothetical protein
LMVFIIQSHFSFKYKGEIEFTIDNANIQRATPTKMEMSNLTNIRQIWREFRPFLHLFWAYKQQFVLYSHYPYIIVIIRSLNVLIIIVYSSLLQMLIHIA